MSVHYIDRIERINAASERIQNAMGDLGYPYADRTSAELSMWQYALDSAVTRGAINEGQFDLILALLEDLPIRKIGATA